MILGVTHLLTDMLIFLVRDSLWKPAKAGIKYKICRDDKDFRVRDSPGIGGAAGARENVNPLCSLRNNPLRP